MLVLDLAVDFQVDQELADVHLLEHFECYLVMVLVVAFHIFEAVVDPSFLYNVHMDPFVVDLDHVDALECVASVRVVDLHEDDIVVDEDALVNDDQEYVVVAHALDALVDGHTLDVAVDGEVVASHPFHCLDDAYEDDVVMAEVQYLPDVMDDILKSSHLEHHDFHYCHYLVVTSCLSYRLTRPGEVMVNLIVHHSVI